MITTDEQGVTHIPGTDGRRSLDILPHMENGVLVLMVLGPQEGLREIVRVNAADLATAVARARNRSRFIDTAEHMIMERHLCDIEKERGVDSALEARVQIIIFLWKTGKLSEYDLKVLTDDLPVHFKRTVAKAIQD